MDLINVYGQLINRYIDEKPQTASMLIRKGYKLEGIMLDKFPDKNIPPSLQYIQKICMDFVLNPINNPERSAIVNLFTPCEFLHAMGIYPQFIEAYASYLAGAQCEKGFIDYAERKGIPETFCSYHKAFLGAVDSDVIAKPRFAITTTLACDANINTFRRAAKHYGIEEYVIDVPYELSEDSTDYVENQLRELVKFIEDNMGEYLNEDKLKEVVSNENLSIRYYKKFIDKLATRYFPNTLTLEMYKIFTSHVGMGTKETLEYYKMLSEDIEKYPESKGIRMLWGHLIPFYQEPLREVFNCSKKYELLMCDLNFDSIIEIDEENIYRGIAQKLILNSFNGKYERRAETMLEMAKKLNADGVINLCHWGCKQSSGGAIILKKTLEKNNVPTLILDGDGVDRRNAHDGQVKTRLEAFIEMLDKERIR